MRANLDTLAVPIAISDAELEELHARLRATRWPDRIEGAGWSYGVDDDYLRGLVADWLAFDWRAREADLNQFEHRRARVDGIYLHYVQVKSPHPEALPLVLNHGWPSSFVEWLRIAPMLVDPTTQGGSPADAFHLIIPSLPGYGFSEIPRAAGMTPRRMAAALHGLMQGLGFERYAVHGCDFGAYVTALMALDYPKQVVGAHMGMVSLQGGSAVAKQATAETAEYAAVRKRWADRELGYIAIQSTKPQTLAYGLTESPAGLAAWIAEKWRAWSDHAGRPEDAIPRETLLTNLSIYWFTRTINSANRLYFESRRAPMRLAPGQRVEVPCGFLLERSGLERASVAPDLTRRAGPPPRSAAEHAFNVQRWVVAPRGGHFPALETPELLIDEIRTFFAPLREERHT